MELDVHSRESDGGTQSGPQQGWWDHQPSAPRGLERRLGLGRVLEAVGAAPPQSLQSGRFVIESKIGEGGMGAVYRARDSSLERTVAVKVLHRVGDEASREETLGEARTLARISHPNVVGVYDVGEEDGSVFLVMEFVDQTNLLAWRAHHPAAPSGEVAALFLQAGEGLAAIHRAGVVHRDFKPANVLLGSDGRVRVADFGLARPHRAETESLFGVVSGTPMYMAPEIYRGRPADARSDQYSFCLSMWELLDPSHPPGESTTTIPSALRRILLRGLQAEPSMRWPSMPALLGALRVVLAGNSVDRRRTILLDRVERLWLDGVMSNALGGREALALPVRAIDGLVDPPWGNVGDVGQVPEQSDTTRLLAVMEAANEALLIVGQPGAGKTMALLLLARTIANQARIDPGRPAPVVLNLSSYGSKQDLERWIEDEVATKYSLPRKAVRSWLENHEVTLMLDGLDEVPASRRGACVDAINQMRARHGLPTVVACREEVCRALPNRLELNAAVRVEPLEAAAIDRFLDSFGETGRSVRQALLTRELEPEMRTPLMLTILALGGADPRQEQGRWSRVYRAYVDRMLGREGSRYSPQQIIRGLSWVARAMQREEVSELWVERLQASWFPVRWQRGLATGLGVALVVAVAMIANLVAALAADRELRSGLIMGSGSAIATFVFIGNFRVNPVDAIRWSYQRALKMGGLATGLGLVLGLVYGRFYSGLYDVAVGGAGGMVAAALMGVEGSDREGHVRPNHGILQSWINGVRFGLAGVLLASIGLGWAVGTLAHPLAPPGSPVYVDPHPRATLALITGAFMGGGFFLLTGGAAALLHTGIRIVLALFTPLPLRLIPFLDHAADRALLRRVGGGYIFMHKTLLEHFAADRRSG